MSSQSERILILEDEPTARRTLEYSLTRAGFNVTTVAKAARALPMAKREQFDLFVTDYYLPDYPGTDFVKLLRKMDKYRHVPVILLTGRAEELNSKKLREDLGVMVVAKPVYLDHFVEVVTKCLALARCAP